MRKHHKKWNVVQSGHCTVVFLHLAAATGRQRHRTVTSCCFLRLYLQLHPKAEFPGRILPRKHQLRYNGPKEVVLESIYLFGKHFADLLTSEPSNIGFDAI